MLALVILAKELKEILRDRRTLFVLLSLPVIVLPLILYGFSKLMIIIAQRQAERTVLILADQETQDAYWELAREAYLKTDYARLQSVAETGSLLQLFRPSTVEETLTIERFQDLLSDFRRQIESIDVSKVLEKNTAPIEESKMLREFQNLVIRPAVLVRFQTVKDEYDEEYVRRLIDEREINLYLKIRKSDLRVLQKDRPTYSVQIVHNSSLLGSSEAQRRVSRMLEGADARLADLNTSDLRIDKRFFNPVQVTEDNDLATVRELSLRAVGGVIPYILLIFSFMGAFYPAIDLGAGEKERSTLESLLLYPGSRWNLVLGKVLAAFVLSASCSAIALLTFSLSVVSIIPPSLRSGFVEGMGLLTLLQLFIMMMPVCFLFASGFVAISIYARSFKEAQNILSPIGLLVSLPALIGLLPGIDNKLQYAFVPLVNVSLNIKDIMLGEATFLYLLIASVINILLSIIMLAFAVWQFHRDSVIFRS